jgi:hypothetical protein
VNYAEGVQADAVSMLVKSGQGGLRLP